MPSGGFHAGDAAGVCKSANGIRDVRAGLIDRGNAEGETGNAGEFLEIDADRETDAAEVFVAAFGGRTFHDAEVVIDVLEVERDAFPEQVVAGTPRIAEQILPLNQFSL